MLGVYKKKYNGWQRNNAESFGCLSFECAIASQNKLYHFGKRKGTQKTLEYFVHYVLTLLLLQTAIGISIYGTVDMFRVWGVFQFDSSFKCLVLISIRFLSPLCYRFSWKCSLLVEAAALLCYAKVEIVSFSIFGFQWPKWNAFWLNTNRASEREVDEEWKFAERLSGGGAGLLLMCNAHMLA